MSRAGRERERGPHLLEQRFRQPGEQRHPIAQRLREVELTGHGPRGDRADLSGQPGRARPARRWPRRWINVESTSSTTSRLARRCRPAGSTAMSTPVSSAAWTSTARRRDGSADRTISSSAVVGSLDSWVIDSMLPPHVGDALGHVAHRAGTQRVAEDDHVTAPAGRAEAGRAALVGDRDLALHAERVCGACHRVAQRGGVAAQVEQHGEDQAVADHDLLDVADVDVVRGECCEEGRGHPRPVAAGDGGEHGRRPHRGNSSAARCRPGGRPPGWSGARVRDGPH